MGQARGQSLPTLIILGITAALSPVSIDILAPSLPALSADLETTAQQIELTVYAFLIGYGVAPALWGRLSDSIGRRPIMLFGMGLYCLSTIGCILYKDATFLVCLRAVQGFGASAGATMARAIVRDLYGASGTTRGMATMISFMAVIPLFMPLMGGVIAQEFSWEACFIAMALIGFFGVAAYTVLVPETLPVARNKVLPADNPIATIIGNHIFAQHTFCNMFCIATMVLFGANFAFILAREFQLDSAHSGIALGLFNGSVALGTYLVWPLMPRLGAHRSIVAGAVMCCLGWALIALLASGSPDSPLVLALPLVMAALGCGLIIALCSGGALAPFSHNSGTASSIYLLIQSIGASALSFAAGQLLPKETVSMAIALSVLGALAAASKLILSRPQEPSNP